MLTWDLSQTVEKKFELFKLLLQGIKDVSLLTFSSMSSA